MTRPNENYYVYIEKIIDGNGNQKVIEPYGDDINKNFALAKMDFANMAMDKKAPFDKMDLVDFYLCLKY